MDEAAERYLSIKNPRLSLEVKDASCANATAALSTAADIPLELYAPDRVREAPEYAGALRRLADPSSFTWRGAWFSVALRQLCHRFDLAPTPMVDGSYRLGPLPELPGLGQELPYFEAQGVRIFLGGMSWELSRSLDFRETAQGVIPLDGGYSREDLWLRLTCQVDELDPGRLVYVRNWRAEDDQGRVLQSPVDELDQLESGTWLPGTIAPYPDQWNDRTILKPAPGGAARLLWLEGDLYYFRSCTYGRVEFPLPMTEGCRSARLGEAEIEVVSLQPPQDTEEPALATGPSVRFVLHKPPGTCVSTPGEVSWVKPQLIGRSGRPFQYELMESESLVPARAEYVGLIAQYALAEDTPERLVLDLAVKSDPVPLLTFRLEDLPLP